MLCCSLHALPSSADLSHVCTAAPQMQSTHTASWISSRWTAGAGQWTGPTSQTSEPCSQLYACMAAAAVLIGCSWGCATILLLWSVLQLVLCILSTAECWHYPFPPCYVV